MPGTIPGITAGSCRGTILTMAVIIGLGMGMLADRAVAADPNCHMVIGSCHRSPLSTADGTGILDQLAIEAFHRIGESACITTLPCERSLLNADQGVTDGDILRIPNTIRSLYPNLVAVPEPLYRFTFQGFTADATLKVSDFDDLKPLRVGYVIGWKILENKVHAAETIHARGAEQLFPLLTEGKAQVVIYERLTGLSLVRENGLQGIRLIEPPFMVTDQYMVLNRRHAGLVDRLAEAIRAMKADGSYNAAFRTAGYEVPP